MTKCLTVDTRFRQNIQKTSSSDFVVNLPIRLNKVVSMQISSIELPISFYGISEANGNNYLYVFASQQVNSTTVIEESKVFVIPDGNYNASDLISTINALLSPKDSKGNLIYPDDMFSYIQFSKFITTINTWLDIIKQR
jgi:hypothetical protein